MKEKLLKLIDACIEDGKFVNTNSNNQTEFIRASKSSVVSSSLYELKYKGENVYFNDRYKCSINDTKKFTTSIDLEFIFEKEPSINISFIEKRNEKTYTTEHKIGKKHLFLWSKDIEFDLIIENTPFQYIMKCGSFEYVLESSVVVDIYDRIIEKRKKYRDQIELNEINKRLKKYNIE